MGLKILTLADVHLGIKTYGQTDPITNLNTRELHTLQTLDKIVDYAIDEKVDLVIVAGDAYNNSTPTPTLQNKFNERITRLSNAGVKCVILDGNHDVSRLPTKHSANEQFSTLAVPNIIQTRFYKEYDYDDNLKIIILPTYVTEDELKDILDKADLNKPTIIVGHFTLKSAFLNDWLTADDETTIDYELFNRPNIIAVVMGHLHKHQIIQHIPLIYYAGSPIPVDFSEEKQPKGFTLLTLGDDYELINHEFIEVDTVKFLTVNCNVTSVTTADEVLNLVSTTIESLGNVITDAIVRVVVECNEPNLVKSAPIFSKIAEYKPMVMTGVVKKDVSERNDRKRNDINKSTSITEALGKYYQTNPNSQRIIKLGLSLVDELNKIEV